MENRFINAIEAAKQSIEKSKECIEKYKNGGDLAKPFLLREEGYLKGLEQKLNTLENLFFQYWMDDTEKYLDELHEKGLA